MFEKAKRARDAFTFSLTGMKTIASFVSPPAIADDRINKIRDAQLRMLETRRSEAERVADRPSPGHTELCVQNA